MSHPWNPEPIDWSRFTRAPAPPDAPLAQIAGKRILVTGAGGSIGSALVRALAQLDPAALVAVDHAELGLYELQEALVISGASTPRLHYVVGSILDSNLLGTLFGRHQPQIVFHAAACKHVPLMEANPFAAVATNVLGTETLIRVASQHDVVQCIVLSTDKAVEPVSIMGATKRVAEQIVRSHTGTMQAKALRLGNVLESSGSVVPLFLRQIAHGGPLTVTHPEATRFFIPVDTAVQSLLATLAVNEPSSILVSENGPAHRVQDLANFLIDQCAPPHAQIPIRFIGLRPGDKLTEQMTSADETLEHLSGSDLHLVRSSSIAPATTAGSLRALHTAMQTRDGSLLLRTLEAAIPGYTPGRLVCQQLAAPNEEASA